MSKRTFDFSFLNRVESISKRPRIAAPAPPPEVIDLTAEEEKKVVSTPLGAFLKLTLETFTQRHSTCTFIDPMQMSGKLVTMSVNLSVVALITCVKYKIPIEALMKSWWRTIARARQIYYSSQFEVLPTAEKIRALWKTLQEENKSCYLSSATNFLYDFHMFGRCNCSCGTVALREILLQVDPKLPTWYIREPGHIYLGTIYDKDNGLQIVGIESTADNKLKFMRDPENKDQENYSTRTRPKMAQAVNAFEWLRDVGSETSWEAKNKAPALKENLPVPDQIEILSKMAQAAGLTTLEAPIPQINQYQYDFFQFLRLCYFFTSNQQVFFNVTYQALRQHFKTMLDMKYDKVPKQDKIAEVALFYEKMLEMMKPMKLEMDVKAAPPPAFMEPG